jgi:uncharacterized SAM-binding protein YcdF (DUF218 family)
VIIALIYKNPKKKKRYLISAFLVLILFSNPYIGDEMIRLWEQPNTEYPLNAKYSAGILLGGDIVDYEKKTDRLIFRSGADRLLQTIDLYNNGVIKKIIISGGSGHLIYRDRTEAAFIKLYLTRIGIDSDNILFESTSKNTYENAEFTSHLLRDNEIRGELLLITSAMHMKRAAATFRKSGIEVDEYPTSKITGDRMNDMDHIVIPSLATLHNWNILIHEITGYFIYKIMGYC